MKCIVCSLSCARCKPAFITCDTCGKQNLIGDVSCVMCGNQFGRDEKKKARDDWKAGLGRSTQLGIFN